MVQQKFFRNIQFHFPVKETGKNELGKTLFEVFEENIAIFCGKQIFDVICVVNDVLEQMTDEVGVVGGRAIVREIVAHHTVYNVVEKFFAHFLQKAILFLEMGIKCAAADVCTVNDILNGNRTIRLFGKQFAECIENSRSGFLLSAIHGSPPYEIQCTVNY